MKKLVLFEPFPKQQEFLDAVFSFRYSFILYGGAIKGGKTYAGLAALILLAKFFPGSRWIVVRKDMPTIKKNTLPTWNKIKPENSIERHNKEIQTVYFKNGSEIMFFSENYDTDKDLDRWKGLDCNGFLLEEINEIQKVSYLKAIERAGSWIIPPSANNPEPKQPPPIMIATCNPTQGWVKQQFYEKWEKGTLPKDEKYIQSRIFDNKPLCGGNPKYVAGLKKLPKYEYEVFVLGNWNIKLKTGGEFLKNFEMDTHIKPLSYDHENILHISMDSNVLPYIAVTCWQIKKEDEIYYVRQIAEKPARDPINTAMKAGNNILNWLKEIHYNQRIKFYGDPTTKARNNIDENKRSFYDLFLEPIKKAGFEVEDKFFRKAPPVSATGDFINEILDGKIDNIRIEIAEDCTESINDYAETKEDKDGGMLKNRITDPVTKQSYEPNGHMTDTLRYMICKAFEEEFNTFRNRFTNYSDGSLPDYDNDLLDGF